MIAVLLLAVAMAGQSQGQPPPAPRVPTTRPAIQIYKIRHEGLTFRVRGYYSPDLKRIVWNEDDRFNQETYSMALVTQATFGDEQEKPLLARPLIASRPAVMPTSPPLRQVVEAKKGAKR